MADSKDGKAYKYRQEISQVRIASRDDEVMKGGCCQLNANANVAESRNA
jgi:hypothetical protein